MIDAWIDQFRNAWLLKDVSTAMSLFSDDVSYYESPHKKYNYRSDIQKGWRSVLSQDDIKLDIRRVASDKNLHTLQWELQYDRDDVQHAWGGLYLVRLNSDGLCDYFLQVGEAVQ